MSADKCPAHCASWHESCLMKAKKKKGLYWSKHRLKTLRNGIGNAIDLAIHAIIVSHEYNKLLAGLFKRAEECDQELQDDQKKRAFSDSNTSLVPCWIKWHVLKACSITYRRL